MAQSGEGSREGDGSSLFQLRGHPPPDYIKEKAESLSWMEVERNSYCYWSKPVAGAQNQQSPTDVPSDLLGSVPESLNGDLVVTEKIKTALCKFKWPLFCSREFVMIQFWAPRRIESRSFLTVSHQPFALGGEGVMIQGLWSFAPKKNEGLWSYRKYCENFECNVEEGQGTSTGPPGRVFRHKLPESSPDVSWYSCNEFPLRDVAVNCGVMSMVTLPLLEPSSCGRCVGVLEVVSFTNLFSYYADLLSIVSRLQVADLTVSDINCKFMEKNWEVQLHAMDEINKMMKMLEETAELSLAQIWGPCKSSNAMASGDCTDGNDNNYHLICHEDLVMTGYCNDEYNFHIICTQHPLRRGQGIVWKALRSRRPCFCSDIRKFNMTEYPLAHHAYKYDLTTSFAISVRSSYTGDLDYVLEFFLSTCSPENYKDDKTLLGSILATMKQHLTSFKVSSGKELREELITDIVEVSTLTDELRSSSEWRTIRSPETLQSEVEVVQVDSSSQQSTAEEASENGVEQSKIALTSLHNQSMISKKEKDITYEGLKPYLGMTTLDHVADIFGVSRSKMKRSCRIVGISEWPSCKRKSVKPTHPNLKNFNESVQSIEERIPESSRKDPSCGSRRMHDATPALVTIKAFYANDIIRFRISSSSTMSELSENLTERLPLKVKSLHIEYQDDEGDWVLLACEKDMQYCLRSMGSSATPIKMRVRPISDQLA